MNASPKLRDRLREETGKAILGAAEEVFAADGFRDARVEKIAERAGVSVGTLYNYFKDRETLLTSLIEDRSKELVTKLSAATDRHSDGPFQEQVIGAVRAMIDHFQQHGPFLVRVMHDDAGQQSPLDRSGKMAAMNIIRFHFESLISRGIALKAIRALDPALAASFLMGLVRAVAMMDLHADRGFGHAHEKIDEIVQFFFHGAGVIV